MSKPKVLFSMPTRHHVEIALDEMIGLQELGYPCESFPYAAKEGVSSTTGRLRVIIENARNLIRIAKMFQPDVVYFNSRLEVLAGIRDFITISLFKMFYRKKVQFVIKSHGSDIDVLHSQNGLMSKIVLPFLRKNISAWLFLSSEEKKKITETNYFSAHRIFTTKNIVRTNQFARNPNFKTRLNIPEDHTILLFVGRIIREKGIYQVVEAFENFSANHNASLIIVGDGTDFENIKRFITERQLSDVKLTGLIPEQDVVEYYANSDVLVFPTYFPEGFPMALFNSVAAGLAIVTTPIRAATDFLSDPENCLWAEPQNSDSVLKALEKLFVSQELMDQMKTNNIQKAALFDREHVSAELSVIIDSITS